ncbi:MAG TPA: sulfotransferase [Allosphingosinicella sp.]
MAVTESTLRRLAELERRDLARARREALAALTADPRDPGLLHFLGRLSCRSGALTEGQAYLGQALIAAPGDARIRADLAMALAGTGRGEEALRLCAEAATDGDSAAMARIEGQILQSMNRLVEAADSYRRVLQADPGDWEIWNNLAGLQWTAGDVEGALAAARQAASIRPDIVPVQANLGAILSAAGELEEALFAYRRALELAPGEPRLVLAVAQLLRQVGQAEEALAFLRDAPDDPEVEVERGRILSALRRLDDAEQAYRSALRRQSGFVTAYVELGIGLERAGRAEALGPLLEQAAREGVAPQPLAYLRALLLESEGRLEEALDCAATASQTIEPVRLQRLVSRLADRLDQPARAFAAADEANRIAAGEAPRSLERAARFRAFVEALVETATPDWLAQVGDRPTVPQRAAPAFLVGFPRSGTTLLDTMLMGHPQTHVLEEIPLLERVIGEAGDMARLPELDEGEIARLRAVYFTALDAAAPPPPGALVIDKLPLNILGTPLIHRLFPDAQLILALRHPCDVVLSCFMQGFEVNEAMANFLDIETTARLYDLVLSFWARCRSGLPLRVHELKYEQIVDDPEAQLRPLAEFLGLPWDERMLDHRRTAKERGVISTPSYNQVTQGLYGRARGRWRRYREQLAPVLPVIEPWARRLGYES